jgi:uncharacterized membrane protein
MRPAAYVFAAWLAFAGTHLSLSSTQLRALMSAKLGQEGFLVFYALIAAITMSALIATVAHVGGSGLPGPNLGAVRVPRWLLSAFAATGAAIATAGLVNYSHSPMTVLARTLRSNPPNESTPLAPPAPIERLTRHPFFVGLAILASAHVLLASTFAGSVYFLGFAVLALLGIPLQDRKLRARHGRAYQEFLEQTTALPLAQPQRTPAPASGSVIPTILAACAGAALLWMMHPIWRIGHGATFAALVLVGGLLAVARQLRASRTECPRR